MSPLDEQPGPELGTDAPAVSWRWQELTLAVSALVVLLGVIVALRSHLDTFVRPQHAASMDTTRTVRERRGETLAALTRAGLVADVDTAGESPRVFTGPDPRSRKGGDRKAATDRHHGTLNGSLWTDNGTRIVRSVIYARSMHGRGAIHRANRRGGAVQDGGDEAWSP